MASEFLEYAEQYELKSNEAVDAFLAALVKQKEAFKKNALNRRSWVKSEGAGYLVTLGKLEKTYRLSDKQDVEIFLDRAADAARGTDTEFQAMIEKAYGKPSEETKTRRVRRPRASGLAA